MRTSSNSTDKNPRHRRCPTCRCGFNLEIGFQKPMFVCEANPTHRWSYGFDGGPYFEHARNVGKTVPKDWVEYVF